MLTATWARIYSQQQQRERKTKEHLLQQKELTTRHDNKLKEMCDAHTAQVEALKAVSTR